MQQDSLLKDRSFSLKNQ